MSYALTAETDSTSHGAIMGWCSFVKDAILKLGLSISVIKRFSWTGFDQEKTSQDKGDPDAK